MNCLHQITPESMILLEDLKADRKRSVYEGRKIADSSSA